MERRGARRLRAGGAALAACALFTGRGGSPPARVSPAHEFAANAADLISQLHDDVTVSGATAVSLTSAQRALDDSSDLYVMLVAYNDFGSCSAMVRNAGTADARFGRVEASLGSACGFLERAARLFADAATRSDARALVRAARTTLQASPLLYRAQVELDAVRGSHP